jgi:hypothetical protein
VRSFHHHHLRLHSMGGLTCALEMITLHHMQRALHALVTLASQHIPCGGPHMRSLQYYFAYYNNLSHGRGPYIRSWASGGRTSSRTWCTSPLRFPFRLHSALMRKHASSAVSAERSMADGDGKRGCLQPYTPLRLARRFVCITQVITHTGNAQYTACSSTRVLVSCDSPIRAAVRAPAEDPPMGVSANEDRADGGKLTKAGLGHPARRGIGA